MFEFLAERPCLMRRQEAQSVTTARAASARMTSPERVVRRRCVPACTLTGVSRVLRKMVFAVIVLVARVSGTGAADLQADTLPWLMSVNSAVRRAYVEVPMGTPEFANAFRVWLDLRDPADCPRIRLIQYARGNSPLIEGCIGSAREPCKLPPAQAALTQAVDTCLADKRAKQYFVASRVPRVICLSELSDRIEPGKEVAGIADVTAIDPRWEWKSNSSSYYLNDLFPTAPFWQQSDRDIAIVGCQRPASAIAAYSTRDSYKGLLSRPRAYAQLTSPHLVWAWTYLVLQAAPFRCGTARYSIDHLDNQFAILPDQTALLVGNRSVIRVRISDGSTDAPATQVQRIPPRGYIERMLLAGQPDCVAITSEVCHWVGKISTPTGGLSEVEYARRWFEGFDRDVRSIFFNK